MFLQNGSNAQTDCWSLKTKEACNAVINCGWVENLIEGTGCMDESVNIVWIDGI